MARENVIDARGSFCPGPLMELIARLKMAQVGDELEVLSTDKGSADRHPGVGEQGRPRAPRHARGSRRLAHRAEEDEVAQ